MTEMPSMVVAEPKNGRFRPVLGPFLTLGDGDLAGDFTRKKILGTRIQGAIYESSVIVNLKISV